MCIRDRCDTFNLASVELVRRLIGMERNLKLVTTTCAFLAMLCKSNDNLELTTSALELVCVTLDKFPLLFVDALVRNGVLQQVRHLATADWELDRDGKLQEMRNADSRASNDASGLGSCLESLKQQTTPAKYSAAVAAMLHYVNSLLSHDPDGDVDMGSPCHSCLLYTSDAADE